MRTRRFLIFVAISFFCVGFGQTDNEPETKKHGGVTYVDITHKFQYADQQKNTNGDSVKCCCSDIDGEDICTIEKVEDVNTLSSKILDTVYMNSKGCSWIVGTDTHSFLKEGRCWVPEAEQDLIPESFETEDVTDLFGLYSPTVNARINSSTSAFSEGMSKCCCHSTKEPMVCKLVPYTSVASGLFDTLFRDRQGCGHILGAAWHSHLREGGQCMLRDSEAKELRAYLDAKIRR